LGRVERKVGGRGSLSPINGEGGRFGEKRIGVGPIGERED